jgi:hypothetical protein
VRADINDLTQIAVALTHRTESAAVSETVEQQTPACDATGGSKKFMGVTTGAIAYNADQTTLQTALNAFAPLRTVTASLGDCLCRGARGRWQRVERERRRGVARGAYGRLGHGRGVDAPRDEQARAGPRRLRGLLRAGRPSRASTTWQ